METEYQYLLHLLGAWIRKAEPKTADTVDWDKLMQLAQIHSVTGIVGYMGMKYPICPDEARKSAFRSLCLGTVSLFAQRTAAALAITGELEKAGIDHIIMKGLVLRDLYPVPELRTFNDVDIVIRAADRQKCDALMMAMNFQRHTDWEPVYSYVRGKELYELHTEIMEIDVSDRADYKGYFRNMWDHTRQTGSHSFRFAPEFEFLYMLTHIAKHVHGSGAGIRMYLDAAVYIRHYGEKLDWNWIREQLKELKLEDFANTVMTAAEQWFDIPAPVNVKPVAPDVMSAFLDYTMEAGVFGHHNRNAAVTELKHAGQDSASRLRHVLHEVFPKAESIQNRYTYLQDKPWLLPAAWVHRMVKNKDKFGRRIRQMQDVLDADAQEVLMLQNLMREIGL